MNITQQDPSVSAIKQQATRLRKKHTLFSLPKETHAYYLDKISNIYGYKSWTSLLQNLEKNPFPYDVKSIINYPLTPCLNATERDKAMFTTLSSLLENTASAFDMSLFDALAIIKFINNHEHVQDTFYLHSAAFSFKKIKINQEKNNFRDTALFKRNGAADISIISGAPGTGKSILANAILNETGKEGHVSLITPFSQEYGLKEHVSLIIPSEKDRGERLFSALIKRCILLKPRLIVVDESDFFFDKFTGFKEGIEAAMAANIAILIVTQCKERLLNRGELARFLKENIGTVITCQYTSQGEKPGVDFHVE